MSNLSNQYISASYQSLLNLQGAGSGLTANLQVVQDGFGQNTPMSISTTQVAISSLTGSVAISGSLIPGANNTYDLGAPGAQFRHLYVSSGSVWMDDHQILSLGDVGANTQLYAPPSGSIFFRNDLVLDNPSAEYGTTFNIIGNGIYKQANINFNNTENAFISTNQGTLNISNNQGQVGSGSVNIINDNGGKITIGVNKKGDTYQTSGNVEIYSESGSVNLYSRNEGNIVLQNDGSGAIGINSNNKVDITAPVLITGSLNVTGSITQNGTFYPDLIDVSQGGIVETTGAFVATFTNEGILTYDNYQNVATALQPYINTGSFATTGSNTFIGNQTISGSIYTNGAITFSDSAFNSTTNTSGALYFSSLNGGTLHLNDDGGEGDVFIGWGPNKTHINGDTDITGKLTVTDNTLLSGSLVVNNTDGLTVNDTGHSSAYINVNFYTGGTQSQANFQSNADNTYIQSQGNLNLTTALNGGTGSISITAPNLNLTSNNGFNYTGTTSLNGNLNVTGTTSLSGNLNVTGATSLNGNLNVTGATSLNGNLNVNGNQVISGSLIGSSVNNGMIKIFSDTFNSSSVKLNITGSNQASQANLIFGSATSVPTATGSIILSGSNNILLTGTRGATVPQGFVGYVNGTNNILSVIPQYSTSSVDSVITNNNILFSTPQFDITTGSGPSIFNNNIALGAGSTIVHRHKSGSIDTLGNLFLGSLNSFASRSFIDGNLNYSPLIQSNIINGTSFNLLNTSSSIVLTRNIINASSLTVNNQFTNPTNYAVNGSGSVTLSNNIIGGNTHTILSSGSALTDRTINNNLVIGYGNNLNQIASGSVNTNLTNTAILGQGLIVSGSNTSTTTTGGSTFVGRWNATGSLQESTQDSIFVVGAGTSAAARSNALHIDSSSNIRMTGSLLVSGSLSLNGNIQFNVGAFQSTQTQSGSANVSQSITYNTTDYSQGVSVAGSQITLANKGVYNIQFSAQIDRVAGSGTDTVYIWLKKNGSNVAGSAGAITISGGATAAKTISSWNYVVDSAANDYYELVWQTTDSNIQLIAAAASGNIPSIPSIITTVTQVR